MLKIWVAILKCKELSKNKERLEIASIKSLELDNNSNEIKDIVNN